MRHKLVWVCVGLFAVTALSGPASDADAAATPTAGAMRDVASASASQGIVNARKAGAPGPLVAMPPQSNLKLLSHATLIGSHAQDATIELTFSLKLRHTVKLKKYLSQANYQPVTPRVFSRLYGPTKAQVARVEGFLEAHRIQVLNVSLDRTLIHTEATTLEYEHALDIRINDYTLNGRRFYSTSDSPEIPRALAPLVLGILGLNHTATDRLGGSELARELPSGTQPASSQAAPSPNNNGGGALGGLALLTLLVLSFLSRLKSPLPEPFCDKRDCRSELARDKERRHLAGSSGCTRR